MIEKEKAPPLLIIFGASILLFRTIRLMFFEDGLIILALWTKILTFIEMIIDLLCVLATFKWLKESELRFRSISLWLGSTVTIFHALRVLIYILGRVGPWKDFDKDPVYRLQGTTNTFWLLLAGSLSVVGVFGVIIIGKLMKQKDNEII